MSEAELLAQEDDEELALLEAEPPSAEKLGVDVEGLPPQQARLVRYVAWIGSLKTELEQLEDGRAKFLDLMGVPAITEERLRALIEADTSNYLNWMRSGAQALTKAQARSFEREQLEAKLSSDRHNAEVANAAMDRAEAEIDAKRRQITALEKRHESFIYDALIGHADGLGADYVRLTGELRDIIRQLLGLATIVKTHSGFRDTYAPFEAHVGLPEFALPSIPNSVRGEGKFVNPKLGDGRLRIDVDPADAREAAEPWRELARRWLEDPRANLE